MRNDRALRQRAYSTVGNAGVDGIMMRPGVGSHLSKAPARMHMNALANGNDSDPRLASH